MLLLLLLLLLSFSCADWIDGPCGIVIAISVGSGAESVVGSVLGSLVGSVRCHIKSNKKNAKKKKKIPKNIASVDGCCASFGVVVCDGCDGSCVGLDGVRMYLLLLV